MFAKRSQILKNIETVLKNNNSTFENTAVKVLEVVELFMEPKLRPLTEREVNEHVLVTQVHESRKEEVRNFVRNLDYEMKREFVPEDA
jgi:hypothetical protein